MGFRLQLVARPGVTTLIRYVGSRLLQAIPLLIGVVTLIFVLLHLAPGDPTSLWFHPDIPPEVMERMRESMGLDLPLHQQYLHWLKSFFTGDFGYSYSHFRPVSAVIGDALPATLLLGGAALLVAFGVGSAVGAWQAVRRGSPTDSFLTVVTLFLYSMPGFWLGLMLILAASTWLAWLGLPVSGMTSVDHASLGPLGRVSDLAGHLVLPTIALGLGSAAGVARFMRGEMLEAIGQDYVRTARAKGLPEGVVIRRHALRNALLPMVSLLGLYLPILFGGAVVIEVVFSWPGMGRTMYDAVLARDYPLVMATSFLFGLLVIAGNLLADLLYAFVDPRVRYD
ncbi:MAG: ABC transporter permease [marine benthic group bacterium]|nr:ABC transporter permease [Gemmatimonadota bacterium]